MKSHLFKSLYESGHTKNGKIVGSHKGYYIVERETLSGFVFSATTERCDNPLGFGEAFRNREELVERLDNLPYFYSDLDKLIIRVTDALKRDQALTKKTNRFHQEDAPGVKCRVAGKTMYGFADYSWPYSKLESQLIGLILKSGIASKLEKLDET